MERVFSCVVIAPVGAQFYSDPALLRLLRRGVNLQQGRHLAPTLSTATRFENAKCLPPTRRSRCQPLCTAAHRSDDEEIESREFFGELLTEEFCEMNLVEDVEEHELYSLPVPTELPVSILRFP